MTNEKPEKRIDTTGYHSYRLTPEQNNRREVAFAREWEREHEGNNHDIAAQLICFEPETDPQRVGFFGGLKQVREISDEERRAMATVIQWLGSNVGFSFLENSLEASGFRIVPRDQRR